MCICTNNLEKDIALNIFRKVYFEKKMQNHNSLIDKVQAIISDGLYLYLPLQYLNYKSQKPHAKTSKDPRFNGYLDFHVARLISEPKASGL